MASKDVRKLSYILSACARLLISPNISTQPVSQPCQEVVAAVEAEAEEIGAAVEAGIGSVGIETEIATEETGTGIEIVTGAAGIESGGTEIEIARGAEVDHLGRRTRIVIAAVGKVRTLRMTRSIVKRRTSQTSVQ